MMNRLTVACLALSLFAPVALGQKVTFTKKEPGVGDRRTETGSMSMNIGIEVSMNGQVLQSMEQKQSENEKFTTTIHAAKGGKVTKIEVQCLEKNQSGAGPAGNLEDESPLVGKTYIATKTGDEITVTDAEGNAFEDEEVQEAALEDAEERLQDKSKEFRKMIPGEMEVGQTIEVDEALVREFFMKDDGNEEMEEIKMTLTLKGTKQHAGQEMGVFDVVLGMGGEPQEGMSLVAELKGELLVGTQNCWPYEFDMAGDLEISGTQGQGGQEIKISGKGPMKMKRSASYSKAE